MAVVGEALIVVRALTDKVSRDIEKGFSGIDGVGRKHGLSLGKAFSDGMKKGLPDDNVFSKITDGLRAVAPAGEQTRKVFQQLTADGYTMGTILSTLLGALSALIGGLVGLAGTAGGAAASIVVLGNVFASFGLAMIAAKLALGGVGKALAALGKQTASSGASAAADAKAREAAAQRVADAELNLAQVIEDNRNNLVKANNDVRDSQLELNKAIVKGQEEIQQLGFDAEDAALSESKAALELDKARETLARTQDLPPNSRARKEAELAFQEAELNLRKAKDKSADLNKEQDRLARTGVAGTNAVISANQRLAQAEANKTKVIQDSLRKQAQAERDLAKARQDAADAQAGSGGGGADPMEGLNQFQKDFVTFIASLKPKLTELKLAISEAFLPPLQQAIGIMVDGLFPTVKTGMTQVATATGVAVVSFANMATEIRNVQALGKLFENSSKIIAELGTTAGHAYGIALSLLNAAAPQAERFVGFLNGKLLSFDEYLKSDAGKTKVSEFFTLAGDAAAGFGEVFGNLFSGFGAIIQANLGPGTGGDNLLQWLKTATQGFGDMDAAASGPGSLRQYFIDVASNSQKVMSSIGALIGELIKLGQNQAIGQTFDILKEGAPALGELLNKGVAAGPVLAELITKIVDIANKMTDTGAMETFFGILNLLATTISDLLGNPVINAILTVTGQFFAMGIAISKITSISKTTFDFLMGDLQRYVGFIGKSYIPAMETMEMKFNILSKSSNGFTAAVGRMGQSVGAFMKGPMGIALVVIAAIVGALILLYNTSDTFKASVDGMFAQLGAVFEAVVPKIMAFLTPLIEMFMEMAQTYLPILLDAFVQVFNFIAPIVMDALGQIMSALAPLLPVLMDAFQQISTALMDAFQQIMPVVQTLLPVLAAAFQQILGAILPLIPVLINALVPAFMSIVQAVIPLVTMLISTLMPVFGQIIQQIAPLVAMLITVLVPVFLQVVQAILPLVTMILTSLVPVIIMLVEAFVPLITMLIEALVPVIIMVIEILAAIIPPIIQIVTTIINILVPVFTFLLEVVVNVITGIINFFVDFVSFIITLITNYVSFWITVWTSIFQFLSDVWNNIVKFVTDAWNALVGFLQPALDAFFKFWSDIFTNVGNFISDTWNNIVKFFQDGWNLVSGWITNQIDIFLRVWGGVFTAVGNFISDTWKNIVKFFTDGWNLVYGWISGEIDKFLRGWKIIFGAVGSFISDVWKNIVGFFKSGWETVNSWITGAINGFVGFWEKAFSGISTFVSDIFNGLVGIMKGPINSIIDLINGMIGGLNKIKIDVPDWVPLLGGKTISFNVPSIPRLAAGGIVAPSKGGTLAQIAEAGKPERVEPLDQNGMSKRDKYMMDLIRQGAGNINITVNPSAGMDESELARAISREITFQMRRGAVA